MLFGLAMAFLSGCADGEVTGLPANDERTDSLLESKPDILKEKRSETIELQLEPSAFTDKVLEDVRVVIEPDDTIIVSFKGQLAPGAIMEAFDVNVDLDKKTYTATLENEEDSDEFIEKLLQEDPLFFENKETPHAPVMNKTIWKTTLNLEITTKDPLFLTLCRTTHILSWNYDGTTAQFNSRALKYFAANPTLVGTRWYHSSSGYSYLTSTSTKIMSEAYAKYWNSDFGNPTLRTYVDHRIYLAGLKNGYLEYSSSTKKSGEFSWLLISSVRVWVS